MVSSKPKGGNENAGIHDDNGCNSFDFRCCDCTGGWPIGIKHKEAEDIARR
jgi:hypothetical protein